MREKMKERYEFQADNTDAELNPRQPFVEPKLKFVEPKLDKVGSVEEITAGFFGTFYP